MVKKCLPVLSWLPKYQCSYMMYDIIAGVTVALTAIPQSIAYGILSNLGPEYGLYSNILGCLAYAVFGSVKDVTIAPTSLTAIMVQNVVKELDYGSFTRSALNNSSGVRTTMSCAVTAVMLTLSLALLTDAIYYIPKTTLASVVISAMLFMVDYEEIGNIWRTKKLDVIPFLATALACLFYELDYGILVGIGINCCILLYLMSTPGLSGEEIQLVGLRILLVKNDQSLAFSSAECLRDWIMKRIGQREDIDLVVIDGHNVHFADTTVAKNFVNIEEDLRTQHIQLLLWRFQANVAQTLLRMRKELFITMLRADLQLQDAVARWKYLHSLPSDSTN
uniref:STAS domain-containing protein n=1 Tax=Anopheles culicifacies TaxID=139723 RepID=A0A182LWM2_9DIPT